MATCCEFGAPPRLRCLWLPALTGAVVLFFAGCTTPTPPPRNANWHIDEGLRLDKIPGSEERAEAEFLEALRIDPNSATAHNNLGYLWSKTGRRPNTDILAEYETAVRLDPGESIYRRNLGLALARDPKRRDEAIQQYREAIRLRYDYPEAWSNLGRALAQRADDLPETREEDLEQAAIAFRMAAHFDPDNSDAMFQFAKIKGMKPEGRAEAIKGYRAVLLKSPDDVGAMNNLALLLLGNPEGTAEATQLLERAFELSPDNAMVLTNLGAIRGDNDDTRAEGLEMVTKAIELNPEYMLAYQVRAGIRQRMGDPEGAITDINIYLDRNPREAAGHFLLAWALFAEKHWAEAGTSFEKAFELNPKDTKAAGMRARCYEELGRIDDTIEWLSRAIDLDPENALMWNFRGAMYEKQGRIPEALADFSRAVEKNPNDPRLWSDRASLLEDKKDWAAALSDLNECVRLAPGYPFALSRRADAKEALGDTAGAMEDLDRAIENEPKNSDRWYDRARLKQRMHDTSGALRDYREVVNLKPDYSWAYLQMGRILLEGGDPRGAIEHLDKALAINPKTREFWRCRSNAKNALGDFRGAIADIEEGIKHTDMPKPYDEFRRYLLRRRLGEPVDDLVEALAKIASGESTPWTRTVALFLIGRIEEGDFLKTAGEGDDHTVRRQRCEAFYYAGMIRLLDGRDGAMEMFRECTALGIVTFYEHELAVEELRRSGMLHDNTTAP